MVWECKNLSKNKQIVAFFDSLGLLSYIADIIKVIIVVDLGPSDEGGGGGGQDGHLGEV
jgi:hypothetical protein